METPRCVEAFDQGVLTSLGIVLSGSLTSLGIVRSGGRTCRGIVRMVRDVTGSNRAGVAMGNPPCFGEGAARRRRRSGKHRQISGKTLPCSVSFCTFQGSFALPSAPTTTRPWDIRVARCRKAASFCGSRSPSRIARTMRCPVHPLRSLMTFASWMFICVSAFCIR